MIYCNDYKKKKKSYLRNLVYYRVAISNMSEDIAEDKESIGAAKIANYETNPGGASELNGVEASAEKSMHCSEQMRQLIKLQRQVKKL